MPRRSRTSGCRTANKNEPARTSRGSHPEKNDRHWRPQPVFFQKKVALREIGRHGISVVLVTCDRAEQMCAAVQSLLAQQEDQRWSFELVVVDDGSGDRTLGVLQSPGRAPAGQCVCCAPPTWAFRARATWVHVPPRVAGWRFRQGGSDTDLFRRVRDTGADLWFAPAALAEHVLPAQRFRPEYLRWIGLKVGAAPARILNQRHSRPERLAAAALRCGVALLRDLPMLCLARVTGSPARAFEARCKERTSGSGR